MRKLIKIALLSIIIFTAKIYSQNIIPLQNLEKIATPKYQDVIDAYNEYWKDVPIKERKGWKQFNRWANYWESRLLEDGSFPNASVIKRELENYRSKNKQNNSIQASKSWKLMGPSTKAINGSTTGLGRINVVRFKPGNDKTLWVGTAGGGLWRSTNDGSTWENYPFFDFLSIGISDIAIAESNPNIIYVATGDADGLGAGQAAFSIGIVKSTDGGATWQNTGFTYSLGKYIVAKLLVSKTDPNKVFAATNNGIYKSIDGGVNWTLKVSSGYFKDMEFSGDDENIMISTTFGWGGNNSIYLSTDNGDTWKTVKNLSGCVRIAVEVSLSNTNVMYALAASTNRGFHSLLRSDDKGLTWTTMSASSSSKNILGWGDGSDKNKGQGEYDLALAVNPGNEDEIFTGGVNIWKSNDGGTNWEMIAHWYGGFSKPFVHADHHDLQFNLESGYLYGAHDGGIDKSTNAGVTWTNITNGMSITQFYKFSTAQNHENLMYAGAQDNGTFRYEDGKWYYAAGGDGMDCLVDYNDYKRAYLSLPNGDFQRTANGSSFSYMIDDNLTKEAGNWVTPITIDPIRPNILYTGFRSVWRTDNYGQSWRKFSNFSSGASLRNLACAPSDTNVMYASNTSQLWGTYDAGKTWTLLNSSLSYCRGIIVDYKNPKRFWVAIGGFTEGSKVLEYDGTEWKNVSGNLPNISINCIVLQKNSPDRLYIGTDAGVFYSDYNSGNWEQYGDNVKNIVFTDIEIQENLKRLRGCTYGRGVWEIDLVDCNLVEPMIKANGATTFCFGDSVELEAVSEQNVYKWSNGMIGKKITIKESGTYSLSYEDASGCKSRSKGITVFVSTPPPLVITSAGNTGLCEGGTIDLTASFGFTTYEWSNGGNSRKITVNKPGKYTVKGSTKDGCSIISKEFEVVTIPKPEPPTVIRYNSKQLMSSLSTSYQWYCNDTIIANATSRIVDIKKLGKYTVEIANENGCKNKSDYFEVISDVISDFSTNEYFILTPNPTNGIFNLEMNLNLHSNYEIIITNILGEKVNSFNGYYSGGDLIKSIDISNLAVGIYYVQLTIGDLTYKEKLIKN